MNGGARTRPIENIGNDFRWQFGFRVLSHDNLLDLLITGVGFDFFNGDTMSGRLLDFVVVWAPFCDNSGVVASRYVERSFWPPRPLLRSGMR